MDEQPISERKARKVEYELDLAFAEAVRTSETFAHWLLRQTKFAALVPETFLLHEEQRVRHPANWWRHWWCRVPELGRDSETDVFLVFENGVGGERFALHVENKPTTGRFTKVQPESYGPRARYMAGEPKYLNYRQWETVLIAPKAFMDRYADEAAPFDRRIAYEAIAEHVPAFRWHLRTGEPT